MVNLSSKQHHHTCDVSTHSAQMNVMCVCDYMFETQKAVIGFQSERT